MGVTMYDAVNTALIPRDAKAVAGYVDGLYANFGTLVRDFPHAQRLSIAVSASANAECLDVEPGDASPGQAPAWVKRQHGRGIARPVVYCSVSQAPSLLHLLAGAGIQRDQFRLWTAHYTGKAHLCSNGCGYPLGTTADATQWDGFVSGGHPDISLCADDFFGPVLPAKIAFTKAEAHTLHLLEVERARPHSGDSTTAKGRRRLIRQCKRKLLVYRAGIRLAAALTGWDKLDRHRRYEALLLARTP